MTLLPPASQSSLHTQHASTDHNSADAENADTNTTSVTSKPRVISSSPLRQSDGVFSPRYKAQEGTDEEPLHKYTNKSENSSPSVEQHQRKLLSNKKRQITIQPQSKPKPSLEPEQPQNQILGRSTVTNASNIDNDQITPPQDCLKGEKTSEPIPYSPPQSACLVEDYRSINDCSSATSSDGDSSCVSSLSADDCQHFSNLAFVKEHISSDQMVHRNSHRRHRRTQSDMNRISKEDLGASHYHQINENNSSLGVSSGRDDGVPQQLTVRRKRSVEEFFDNAKDPSEEVSQRGSKFEREDSAVVSLDRESPLRYRRRTISAKAAPNTKLIQTGLKIQRLNNKHTLQNTNKYTQPIPGFDKPAPIRKSRSYNANMSLSQYHRCSRQNNANGFLSPDISVDGGSCSATSESYASTNHSIIVSGRVVNDIKHRMRPSTAPLVAMKSDSMEEVDEQTPPQIFFKSATLEKLGELEPTSSESLLKPFRCDLSQPQKTQGKRKRRRAVKDDLKYLAGKIIPTPLKGMKAVLKKKKGYDLERSSGCLT